jgi:hypothetical protein
MLIIPSSAVRVIEEEGQPAGARPGNATIAAQR